MVTVSKKTKTFWCPHCSEYSTTTAEDVIKLNREAKLPEGIGQDVVVNCSGCGKSDFAVIE